jgi:hypothetical protein
MKAVLVILMLSGEAYEITFPTMKECMRDRILAVLILDPREVKAAECRSI